MTSPKTNKCIDYLLPGEQVIDCIKFYSFYRPCEFVLTDRRLLVAGYTGALGPAFTLLRGSMVAGFPLTEFESFIVGTGRRPLLLLISLSLAVAGGLMTIFPIARYGGLLVMAFSLFAFLAWTAWPRTFATVSGKGIKVSGRIKLCEAIVFLERMQLAASAAKAGKSAVEVREAAALSGRSAEECQEKVGNDARVVTDQTCFDDCSEKESAGGRESA